MYEWLRLEYLYWQRTRWYPPRMVVVEERAREEMDLKALIC
jgi:hypothetical protein